MNTNTAAISEDDRFTVFLLSYADTIGCETIRHIDAQLGKISDIFRLTDSEMKNMLGMKEIQISEFNRIKRQTGSIINEYEILNKSDIKFCTFKDSNYPKRLRRIKQSPAVLYSYGALPDDSIPSVGIVGSRACTAYGASAAEYLGESLALRGVSVVSGMAVGIDAAAHRGALKCGGRTYAVLAGGVNVIYPKENKYIYDEIIRNGKGAALSEMIPGKPAISRNFPMRNRIISGLSDLLIIVEAKEKSGSLITVKYAKDQNVPVMAVPGRITDPMSKGTNRLISEGCDIVAGIESVFDKLKIPASANSVNHEEKVKGLDNAEKIVYSTLVSDPKHIQSILDETGLSSDKVLEALVALELKGLIKQISSNYYVGS